MSAPNQAMMLGHPPAGPGPEWETAFSVAGNFTATGGLGTIVTKIAPAGLSKYGNNARVTFKARGGPLIIADAFIGRAATSGNAWGFDGGQQRLSFGGANGVTIDAGDEVTSDGVGIAIDGSRSIAIAINTSAGSWPMQHTGLSTSNFVSYTKATVQNADDAGAGPGAVAGYGAYGGRVIAVSKIEIG